MNGSSRKHGKTIGYAIQGDRGALIACHGLSDATTTILLHGTREATMYPTLRAAQRAVRESQKERPDWKCTIIRIKPIVQSVKARQS